MCSRYCLKCFTYVNSLNPKQLLRLSLPTFHIQGEQGRAWMPTLAIWLWSLKSPTTHRASLAFALYAQEGLFFQAAASTDICIYGFSICLVFINKN